MLQCYDVHFTRTKNIEYLSYPYETAIQYASFIISTLLVIQAPTYLWLVKMTLVLIPISCFGLFFSIANTLAWLYFYLKRDKSKDNEGEEEEKEKDEELVEK